MKRAIAVLAPVFLALALGLVSTGAVQADPPVAREPRAVGEFHAITVAGTLQVDVTVGKPASVEISGEADQLAKVTTTVKDGVLVLDTPRRLSNKNRLRVTITVPDLDAVVISGTGKVEVAGVANSRLSIDLPGTSSLRVTGSTGALDVAMDGTSQLDADDLAAKDVRIAIRGTGSATLRASQSLDAAISGTGSVDVAGKPARVKKTVTGTGSVRIR